MTIRVLLSLAGHRASPPPVATLLSGVAAARAAAILLQAARIPFASAASVSARSVRSQVNSGSVRPKCP